MKKYKYYLGIIVLAGLMFSLSLATVARAEDGQGIQNTNSGRPSQIRDDLKAKRDAFKSDMEVKRTAFKAEAKTFMDKLKADREAFKNSLQTEKDAFKKAKADKKAQFCSAAQEMITKKFEGAITALETMQTKTGDIVTKLKADGKDTTLATESLNLSKQKLADAKTKLLAVKAMVPADCTTLTADNFEKIKLGAREAKDLLKESREALRQVVKEIRTLRGEDQNENDNKDGIDTNEN